MESPSLLSLLSGPFATAVRGRLHVSSRGPVDGIEETALDSAETVVHQTPAACVDEPHHELHERLARIEALLDPSRVAHVVERRLADVVDDIEDSVTHACDEVEDHLIPAWRRVTCGEPRLPVTIGIAIALILMVLLPARVANHPSWLLVGAAALLLIGIVAANPKRVDRQSRAMRGATLLLIVIMSGANVASASRLVLDLVRSSGVRNPGVLLTTGAAIWLTNMIVFALWYWEFDSGGPVVRALNPRPHPDFLFPQMTSPELSPTHWEPAFIDYLYLSFTNATAFSPTDVMPMARWTKLTMLVQSAVSLITVALVIARAVNVLK